MQSVPKAGGAKAKVQAAMAPLQHAGTAKQPPKGHSAAEAAAAVACATTDSEVQVREVAFVSALCVSSTKPTCLSSFGTSGACSTVLLPLEPGHHSFIVVWTLQVQLVTTEAMAAAALKHISKHTAIAVDCEGCSLSKSGLLCLVQVICRRAAQL